MLLAGCPGDEPPVDPDGSSGSSTTSVTSLTSPTTTLTTDPTIDPPCGTGGCSETTTGGTTGPSDSTGSTSSGGTSSGSTSSESTSSGSTSSGSTSGASTSESSGTTGGSESSGTTGGATTGVVFIQPLDVGGGAACDPWLQDCPVGEKCNAWDSSGGGSWDANGCFPVDPAPVPVGAVCQVVGSGTSGLDNCELGAMCWDVDIATNEGTCVALCTGSPAAPNCAPAGTSCVIANSGVLTLCLPGCDPLVQDCAPGQACYPVVDSFTCAPDASGAGGFDGDACAFINVCDPGLMCIDPAAVEGCLGGSPGCCTPFCDVTAPGDPCPAVTEECVPFFAAGMAPLGHEDVGVCAIP